MEKKYIPQWSKQLLIALGLLCCSYAGYSQYTQTMNGTPVYTITKLSAGDVVITAHKHFVPYRSYTIGDYYDKEFITESSQIKFYYHPGDLSIHQAFYTPTWEVEYVIQDQTNTTRIESPSYGNPGYSSTEIYYSYNRPEPQVKIQLIIDGAIVHSGTYTTTTRQETETEQGRSLTVYYRIISINLPKEIVCLLPASHNVQLQIVNATTNNPPPSSDPEWPSDIIAGSPTMSLDNSTSLLHPGTIITQPPEIIAGNPAGIIQCTPATGGIGTYSYQWKKGDGTNATGDFTSANYDPGILPTSGILTLYRTASDGCTEASTAPVRITVLPSSSTPLSAGEIGSAQSITAGESPKMLTSIVPASGGSDPYIMWQQSTNNGGTWSDVSDIHNRTEQYFQPGILPETTCFRRRVTDGTDTLYTKSVCITVEEPKETIIPCYESLIFKTHPQSPQPLQAGNQPANLSVKVTGGCGDYSYRWWMKSPNAQTWTSASLTHVVHTDAVLQTPVLHETTQFYCEVTCEAPYSCSTITSEVATITVYPALKPGNISASGSASAKIYYGKTPPKFIGTDATGGYCSAYTYEWQYSVKANEWNPISNTNQRDYQPETLTQTTNFRRKVKCQPGGEIYSNEVTITVTPGPREIDFDLTLPDIPVNYILECTPFTPVKEISDLTPDKQKQASVVNYYDGLGRPLQTVAPLRTPDGMDLVQWVTYDEFGRESRQYLPYVKANKTAGKFVMPDEALPEQQAFYEIVHAGEGSRAFSETVYEPSPLNRVTEAYGPGESWAERPVRQNYLSNEEDVYSWKFIAGNYEPLPYPRYTLYITESTDENGVTSKVYKDKLGRLVMTEQAGEAKTHHVYDHLGRLRAVVPPGVESPADEERCFFYEYDVRGRTIATKTPGAGWMYVIYDKRDRQVMTQDEVQSENQRWTMYHYDDFNRVVKMEEVQTPERMFPSDMQQYYDNSWEPYCTKRSLLKETVYDTYPFPDSLAFVSNELVKDKASNNKGRVTMERVRVLEFEYTSTTKDRFLTTTYYYDDRGRLIQSVAENIFKGTDRISTAYRWSGAVDKTLQESTWLDVDEPGTLSLLTAYTYDELQRLITTTIAINGGEPVTVSMMDYDELVRVQTKNLHKGTEIIKYDYNIRNWATGISSGLFTMELFYDEQEDGILPRYNGDIAGMRWYTGRQGQNNKRTYAFTYDDLSRLTGSQFRVTPDVSFGDDYTEQLTYDATGRLQTLQRYAGQGLKIDSLQYTYAGARLQQIKDGATAHGVPAGVTNYTHDANGNVLSENKNGIVYNLLNLPRKVDLADRAMKFTYTADGRKLRYIAENNDREFVEYKTYNGNLVFGTNDNLEYILFDEGRIIHQDGKYTLEYHLSDHLGNVRVTFVPTTSGSSVVQENTYYPNGAPIAALSWNATTTNKNRYLREGKEYIAEFEWNKYDFNARYYNAWTGLFLQVDPLAEQRYSLTPYNFVSNSPINRVDPTGMVDDWFVNELTGHVYFSSELGKDGATIVSQRFGEGWKWLGDNNMFGEVNVDFFENNSEFITGNAYTWTFPIIHEDWSSSIGYTMDLRENSAAFMAKMDYKQVPTQVIQYTKSQIQRERTPGGTISFDLGGSIRLTEKVGYVPKDYKIIGHNQIGQGVYSTGIGYTESAIRQDLFYGKGSSGWLSSVANAWSAMFGGNHDYRNIGPVIPNMELVNQLRKRK